MTISNVEVPLPTSGGRLKPGLVSSANLATDLAIVLAATFGAHLWKWPGPLGDARTTLFWAGITLVSVWVITAAALRQYASFAYDRSLLDEAAMLTIQAAAMVTVLAVLELFVRANGPLPRIPIFLAMVWCSTLLLRILVFRQLAKREEPVHEVLLVGIGPIARLTAQDIRASGRHRVIGHLAFAGENSKHTELLRRSYAADGAECSILGSVTGGLQDTLRKIPVDEVYIAGDTRKHADEMQEVIRVCEKLGRPFALPPYAFRLERARAVDMHLLRDGYLHYKHDGARPSQIAMKRLFDVVSCAVALWLLLPLFVVVSVAIKLSSRGPVFFKQVRVGMHGRPFNMLKFRSMVVNAEALKAMLAAANEQTGPVFKMRRDPRVTGIGRFIRKYSIDELPQLINVLRGDMSLVGPRPPVPSEVLQYEAWQRRRLSVRPGLTCIWQVSGRNQLSFEDWMYLDMQYIDHWSLAGDFNLLFRTLPVVITGHGAS
jgi:exopolysaccharide biosynthesis polyprenyl glycosylphosphotransferase